ncbi:hypothetical protein K438DRAFT_1770586 [Mycena galopus ATCC 62051]|nr:hypothetical protein K438DRAFT_1770586 [Mycena galopus ATCC 62051]
MSLSIENGEYRGNIVGIIRGSRKSMVAGGSGKASEVRDKDYMCAQIQLDRPVHEYETISCLEFHETRVGARGTAPLVDACIHTTSVKHAPPWAQFVKHARLEPKSASQTQRDLGYLADEAEERKCKRWRARKMKRERARTALDIGVADPENRKVGGDERPGRGEEEEMRVETRDTKGPQQLAASQAHAPSIVSDHNSAPVHPQRSAPASQK